MWSLICSKVGITSIIAVIVAAIIGFMGLRIHYLKVENEQAKHNIAVLTDDLMKANNAINSCKDTIKEKDAAIAAHQNQVLAGNIAVKNYKSALDKAQNILDKAKCVPADEKMGVLDEKSNDEVIDALNCLTAGNSNSCLRLPDKSGK